MRLVTVLLFFVSLNLATMFLTVSGAFPAPTNALSTTSFSGIFGIPQLNWQTIATLGTGGVVAFLSGAFLGSVYAGMLVGIVWVFSCFLTPLGWIVNSFPTATYDIVMAMANQDPLFIPLATAVSGFFSAIFVFVAFIFVMDLFSQRYS